MSTELAAIDLGSNSFHMIVARLEDGKLVVIDRMKEMVRLAGGLNKDQILEGEQVERAMRTLERFADRLRTIDPSNIRAVGTNTMRRAKNSTEIIRRAEAALNHKIEIVSGNEEARLIYLGVAHSIEWNDDPRLVVDIGGGSTELIVGEQFNPWLRESKYMGCVEWTKKFFSDQKVDADRFARAVRAARQELGSSEKKFRESGFLAAIGASGTIRAVNQICVQNGWSETHITWDALQVLRNTVIAGGDMTDFQLPGMDEDRRPVLVGGLTILYAIFQSLGLQEMTVSDGAMREGLLHDLLGRIEHRDVREQTIERLMMRYNVDRIQAQAVEDAAVNIWQQVKDEWSISSKTHEQLVRWSSRIHEIGLAIAHSGYQKHGSYLVENSDLPGFSKQDQKSLWALVRSHRRKIKPHRFDALGEEGESMIRLAVVLRLAALFNRSRAGAPEISAAASGDVLSIAVPPDYFSKNPLCQDDLETERLLLQNVGISLEFNDG